MAWWSSTLAGNAWAAWRGEQAVVVDAQVVAVVDAKDSSPQPPPIAVVPEGNLRGRPEAMQAAPEAPDGGRCGNGRCYEVKEGQLGANRGGLCDEPATAAACSLRDGLQKSRKVNGSPATASDERASSEQRAPRPGRCGERIAGVCRGRRPLAEEPCEAAGRVCLHLRGRAFLGRMAGGGQGGGHLNQERPDAAEPAVAPLPRGEAATEGSCLGGEEEQGWALRSGHRSPVGPIAY